MQDQCPKCHHGTQAYFHTRSVGHVWGDQCPMCGWEQVRAVQEGWDPRPQVPVGPLAPEPLAPPHRSHQGPATIRRAPKPHNKHGGWHKGSMHLRQARGEWWRYDG